MAANPLQGVLVFNNKNTKNKHYFITLTIIVYASKPTKQNHPNCTKPLQ